MKQVENQAVQHLDLCQRCAEKRGFSKVAPIGGPIQDLAEKLVHLAKDVTGAREVEGIRCASCGLMISDFAKTGRLGCPTCYEAFMGQLRPILRKTHGSTTHTGRRPGENLELREERRELRRLRGELARAIRQEEYETAADLRDRIKALQTTAKTSEGANS
jgi:protein arginine kinase activator